MVNFILDNLNQILIYFMGKEFYSLAKIFTIRDILTMIRFQMEQLFIHQMQNILEDLKISNFKKENLYFKMEMSWKDILIKI